MTLKDALGVSEKEIPSLTLVTMGLLCNAALALPPVNEPANASLKTALQVLATTLTIIGTVITVYEQIQALLPKVELAVTAAGIAFNPANATKLPTQIAVPAMSLALAEAKKAPAIALNTILNTELTTTPTIPAPPAPPTPANVA